MDPSLSAAVNRAARAMTDSHPSSSVARERDPRPSRSNMPTRKYDISHLSASGDVIEQSITAPALPMFEDAFGALGHGAILHTIGGPTAVEDLLPGDQIRLADGTVDTLLWRGRMTLKVSDAHDAQNPLRLTRVIADALGLDRPAPDIVLGPTARLLHRANGIAALTGQLAAYVPAKDFIDGTQFIALTPHAPVHTYQLGFARHRQLNVNGIEIESLHPGTAFSLGLRGELLVQFLKLFPHKLNLEDFGALQFPRLRLRDLDLYESK